MLGYNNDKKKISIFAYKKQNAAENWEFDWKITSSWRLEWSLRQRHEKLQEFSTLIDTILQL